MAWKNGESSRLRPHTNTVGEERASLACGAPTLTIEFRGEAEGIVALVLFVAVAVVANAGRSVFTAALITRMRDGILHWAILQPARIAPV